VLTIAKNPYLSHILRLVMCVAISIAGFWCPYFLSYQYAEYDNRMGGVCFFALPFLILAAIFSVIVLYKLICGLKSVQTHWRYLLGCIGVILAIPSIFAVLLLGIIMSINFILFLYFVFKYMLI
jgi:hypothetical protein